MSAIAEFLVLLILLLLVVVVEEKKEKEEEKSTRFQTLSFPTDTTHVLPPYAHAQNSPAVFNKAAMMNVGFVEAAKMFQDMNCVMFHDVDSLAEDDRLLMRCDSQPHHYALTLDRWQYR